jgi:hypothetical protein
VTGLALQIDVPAMIGFVPLIYAAELILSWSLIFLANKCEMQQPRFAISDKSYLEFILCRIPLHYDAC